MGSLAMTRQIEAVILSLVVDPHGHEQPGNARKDIGESSGGADAGTSSTICRFSDSSAG